MVSRKPLDIGLLGLSRDWCWLPSNKNKAQGLSLLAERHIWMGSQTRFLEFKGGSTLVRSLNGQESSSMPSPLES